MVPSGTSGETTTSKVMVATLSATPAFMTPAVVSCGLYISMPSVSADAPAALSATALPFSVVLPATYAVLAGTWSVISTPVALSVPMFCTVIV